MRLTAFIVTIVMLAAACGSGNNDSAPTVALDPTTSAAPSTTAAPTTTSTTAATTETTIDQEAKDRAEIEDVVQRFHAYYYEVGLIEGLPGFEEVATSPIYDRSLITVNDFVSRGYTAGEGEQGHRTIEIRFTTPTTADVEGCLLDGGQVVDQNGAPIAELTPDPAVMISHLILTNGQWLVADFEFKNGEATLCEL